MIEPLNIVPKQDLVPVMDPSTEISADDVNQIVDRLNQLISVVNKLQSGGSTTGPVYNTVQTATATCGSGYTGSKTITVGAGQYSGSTQAEANTKAYNAALQQAQGQLVCTPIATTPPANTTPAAPTVSFNTSTRVLSATHALGTTELEYRVSGGAAQPYAAQSIDNSAHAAGKWEFRVKAATGRNASSWAPSPAISAVAAPTFSTYNVIYGGNSNVEHRGDSYPARTAAFLSGEGDYLHYNGGVSGWGIDNMLGDFANRVTNRMVSGRGNIVVGMEGTNSLGDQGFWDKATQSLTAGGNAYVDKVKQWVQQCYAAGAWKVFWISTLPKTVVPGWGSGWDQEGRLHKATNLRLKNELAALGATYIDLDGGKSLIGSQGAADFGGDTDYSSYQPILTSPLIGGSYDVTGYLADNNPYYGETGGNRHMLVHLKDKGFDVLGRIVADYILNLTKGVALPDRSTYGAAAPPTSSIQAIDWKNVAGIATYDAANKRVGINGNASYAGGATTTKGIGASATDYKGIPGLRGIQYVTTGQTGSMFIGISDAPTGTSFTDLKIGLEFGGSEFNKWTFAQSLGTIRPFTSTPGATWDFALWVYTDRVEAYFGTETAPMATWNIAVNFPCWLDVAMSITSNYVQNPRIEAANVVDVPTF
ncbi:hypothetical protein [Solirubrum puertoriconensis]|uniref:Uncharacterized protein n=1 Tax=Solirubrum puertoriconensis TaxID=1751427 RepID=A0A9X0HNL6_SOLP1|nr:hypothetical protein [Solirubrum puertoriconensis]KUG09387.1 hypothetical protein ASU33_16800 [Solirubrum puertoriconensis]